MKKLAISIQQLTTSFESIMSMWLVLFISLVTFDISFGQYQNWIDHSLDPNGDQGLIRPQRQIPQRGGGFNGQTQSQYLSFDSKEDGKAEAEATDQSSRAVVTGNNGMGQAQSMSSGTSGCDNCYPRYLTDLYHSGVPGVPANAVPPSAASPEYTGLSGSYLPPGQVSPAYPGATVLSYPGAKVPYGTAISVGPQGTSSPGYVGLPGSKKPEQIPSSHPGVAGLVYPDGRGTSVPIGPQGTFPSTLPGTPIYHPGTSIGTHPGSPGHSLPGMYQPNIAQGYIPGTTSPSGLPNYYPGVAIPEAGEGAYPGSLHQPGSIQTNVAPGYIPGTTLPSGVPNYYPGVALPGTREGTLHQPGSIPTNIPPGYLPGITAPSDGSNYYPGVAIPGTDGGSLYPSKYYPGGKPGGVIYQPGTSGGAPNIIRGPGGVIYQPGTSGGAPDMIRGPSGVVYQPETSGGESTLSSRPEEALPSYPGGIVYQPGADGVELDGDSHAISSVKQTDAGTEASASSDGKYGNGVAKSQVSGVYSGSGSFSAQAGITDEKKGAQTQVSGGKEGAMSSAQGNGGRGKSQAQVELSSESGATSTVAQSSGWNHRSNSQVKASSTGGMADAQANGEGSTSSQAQIGFLPYVGTDDDADDEKVQANPFKGGGTASAQSGTFRGQSQSQLEGSFQYGITYHGAAQAGSGSGSAKSQKPFNFTNSDPNLFKPLDKIKPLAFDNHQDTTADSKSASSTARRTFTTRFHSKETFPEKPKEKIVYERSDEYDEYEDEDAEEEEDEDVPSIKKEPVQTKSAKSSNFSKDKHLKEVKKAEIMLPGNSFADHKIPPGFKRKVTTTYNGVQKTGKPSAQTIILPPIGKKFTGRSETKSLKSNHHPEKKQLSTSSTKSPVKSNYYTVTNSVAGNLDNSRRKYEHRYYTKTSTCGYFTFSCNIVHGSNGRTKICKPKLPTYPDGTPMKC